MILITGVPGCGKTTLAVESRSQLLDKYNVIDADYAPFSARTLYLPDDLVVFDQSRDRIRPIPPMKWCWNIPILHKTIQLIYGLTGKEILLFGVSKNVAEVSKICRHTILIDVSINFFASQKAKERISYIRQSRGRRVPDFSIYDHVSLYRDLKLKATNLILFKPNWNSDRANTITRFIDLVKGLTNDKG